MNRRLKPSRRRAIYRRMVTKRLINEAGHRRKFLAVIDDTPECERAVLYAARRAVKTMAA
jgi:hypothetical protein